MTTQPNPPSPTQPQCPTLQPTSPTLTASVYGRAATQSNPTRSDPNALHQPTRVLSRASDACQACNSNTQPSPTQLNSTQSDPTPAQSNLDAYHQRPQTPAELVTPTPNQKPRPNPNINPTTHPTQLNPIRPQRPTPAYCPRVLSTASNEGRAWNPNTPNPAQPNPIYFKATPTQHLGWSQTTDTDPRVVSCCYCEELWRTNRDDTKGNLL